MKVMNISPMHRLKNESQVRQDFWEAHAQFERVKGKRQNAYPAEVRTAFVEHVDYLCRCEIISESLAQRVTL